MRKASRVKPRLGSEGAHTLRAPRSTRDSAPVTMTTKADPRWTMAYVHQLPNTLGSRSTPFSHTHLLSIGGAISTSFKPTIGRPPSNTSRSSPTHAMPRVKERTGTHASLPTLLEPVCSGPGSNAHFQGTASKFPHPNSSFCCFPDVWELQKF